MPDHKHSALVREFLRMKYSRYDKVIGTQFGDWSMSWEDQRLREQIQDEEKDLSTISLGDVQVRINRERTKKASAEEAARLFNKPEATADCVYWPSMNWWTAEETTALLLGKSPERVSWKAIEAAVNASAFAHEFARLMRRVLRAPEINQLSDKKTPPEWIDWAISNQVAVPPKLLGEIESRGRAIESTQELMRKKNRARTRVGRLARTGSASCK